MHAPAPAPKAPLRFPDPSPRQSPIVCHCLQITAAEIRLAIRQGADTAHEVRSITSAGTACRACHCRIERLLQGLPLSPFTCGHCGGSSFLCACGENADGCTGHTRLA